MSNKRYIEFDSTYRNRNCYPCPADFTVKVTCAKDAENGLTANDYVANEYPQDSWYQVPYAGSTSEDLVNKKYVLNPDPDVNLGVGGSWFCRNCDCTLAGEFYESDKCS